MKAIHAFFIAKDKKSLSVKPDLMDNKRQFQEEELHIGRLIKCELMK